MLLVQREIRKQCKCKSMIVNKHQKYINYYYLEYAAQPAITCLELTIETLKQDVKYVQS